ncbi:large conductance mechanosensitive channel protein MscL [Cellulosimicrobium sp. Marseille-Q4280]|uniref:large conductance mechanosensitive channel protein MscL n=1 Tax=Cellulosimicrobium sp. Marseille-Q4280 TaxID=2937992 RepID=UPI00203EDDD9|nr:large conductance mechanosensitive channel protein MscL [Cellulosimicrobium sp. Marseille-Q4280]
MSVLSGFKEFVLRGNAIDLAVGVVIGAAFTSIVTAIVNGLISPLIAMIFGKPDISNMWKIGPINEATINMGLILNALLQFLLVAVAIYFVIVLPMNHLAARRKKDVEPEPEAPAEDVRVLQEIRDLLAAQAGAPGQGGPGAPGAGPTGGPLGGHPDRF